MNVYGNVPKLKRIDCCIPTLFGANGAGGRIGIDGRGGALNTWTEKYNKNKRMFNEPCEA